MTSVIAFINPAVSTTNVGDLFITDSLKRIVRHDRTRSFDVDPRKPVPRETIDRINRDADAAVICGTNLWYKRMARRGRWMLTLDDLRAMKVPIIPLGVGTTRHHDDCNDFEPDTLAQIRQIHASCAVGSASDVRTAEVLDGAGVRNVATTGCPTLFRSLAPIWRQRRGAPTNKVVVTVRKGAAKNVYKLVRELTRRGLEPVVAAQQDGDNFLATSIPFVRKAASTVYTRDMRPYIELVDQAVGAIGWRPHGNMLHLAHGNPAILFANCSRGQSFCRTFGLPVVPSPDHVELPEETIAEMVEALLDRSTFRNLPATYAEYRESMVGFLEANGLEHNLDGADELALSAAVI
jgi:hypothetical protein